MMMRRMVREVRAVTRRWIERVFFYIFLIKEEIAL